VKASLKEKETTEGVIEGEGIKKGVQKVKLALSFCRYK
jgi:hypothetical protein